MAKFFSRKSKSKSQTKKSIQSARRFERLEDRSLLTTFSVTTLSGSGTGSLRQAILDANATAGFDTINFSIAGTISLNSGALPTVADGVTIDGTSAPGYSGLPLVQIDFNNFNGLALNAKATGSVIEGLSLVDAKSDGLTLNGTKYATIESNFIGLDMDGETADANRGNGVALMNASNNIIEGNVISANKKNGSVRVTSQGVQIGGTLTSTPNKTFTLEFFASSSNNASGQEYLGTVTVKTNKNGVGIFTFFGPVPSVVGTTYFTATATDPSNNTSAFSAGVA